MLMFAFAAAVAVPQPGKLMVFKDWTVACDNIRHCAATMLQPEDADYNEPFLRALIERPADADAPAVLTLTFDPLPKAPVTVRIDGKPIANMTVAASAEATLTLTPAMIAALANGTVLSASDGKTELKGSLAGLSATLRYLDAQQMRAGTVTALVARGTGKAPPPPPAPPVVRQLRAAATARAVMPGKAALAPFIKKFDCEADGPPTEMTLPQAHALGGGATLVLLGCGAGAYNFSSLPLVVRGTSVTLAAFDRTSGWGEDANSPMLVNAGWDDKTGILSSYAKGRGIGDCGTAQQWVWDGTRFRLTEQTEMGECRGSIDWLRTWTVTAR